MWAGEMLQSERIKSESYVKTEAHCSHTKVSSLTTANKLSHEHWLGLYLFIYMYFISMASGFIDHTVAALQTLLQVTVHRNSQDVFPQNASSFPNRSHNIDTTSRDWPEVHLPSLKSIGSDQYLNPLVFFFPPPLFPPLFERFHFFLLWIWEPVCDQSGFWSSSISNKSERPRRDYVNAWWQQPGCDAGWGGEGAGYALPCACASALTLG